MIDDRRERAVGAVLLLACFLSSTRLVRHEGVYREDVASFNFLPPPWLTEFRLSLFGDSFWTHGLNYLLGLSCLLGACALLGQLRRGPSLVLAFGLAVKAYIYSGDFRLWSGYDYLHLSLGVLYLAAPASRLAAVRIGLALVISLSGLNQLVFGEFTPTAILQLLVPFAWVLPRPLPKVATGLLVVLFLLQGLESSAEDAMTVVPCLLLTEGEVGRPRGRLFWLALAGVAGVGLLSLGHPQVALISREPEVRAEIRIRKGDKTWMLEISDSPRTRMKILQAVGETGSGWKRIPVMEPILAGETVIFNPAYFKEEPASLQEPHLYQFYADEVARRLAPDELQVRFWRDGKLQGSIRR